MSSETDGLDFGLSLGEGAWGGNRPGDVQYSFTDTNVHSSHASSKREDPSVFKQKDGSVRTSSMIKVVEVLEPGNKSPEKLQRPSPIINKRQNITKQLLNKPEKSFPSAA
jgi:hypothetical protein